MKYAVFALLFVISIVVLPETNGQTVYMTGKQCHITENGCPSRWGDKSCNRCCRDAGCDRGDCDMYNCKCTGCPRG